MRPTLLLLAAMIASAAVPGHAKAQETELRVSAISTALVSARQGLPGTVNLLLPVDSVLPRLEVLRAAQQLGYAITERNQSARPADVLIKVGSAAIRAGDAKFILHVTGTRGSGTATRTREVTLTRVNGKWSVTKSKLLSIT